VKIVLVRLVCVPDTTGSLPAGFPVRLALRVRILFHLEQPGWSPVLKTR